jgi:hypothetical protein
MPPKKDWKEWARKRDEAAAAAGGPQPAPPADRARAAEDRVKLRSGIEKAAFFQKWFYAVFFADPQGALECFLDRVEQGIETGRYTQAEVLEYFNRPSSQPGIIQMLSFSIPGRKVYAHELASWDAQGVVEEYMQRAYASAEGDVERLGNLAEGLSLGGGAAPVGNRVRRASLVPSAAWYPTSPAASLQAPMQRPGLAAFNARNTARQQERADAEAAALAAGRPPVPLPEAVASGVNRTHWRLMPEDDRKSWDR